MPKLTTGCSIWSTRSRFEPGLWNIWVFKRIYVFVSRILFTPPKVQPVNMPWNRWIWHRGTRMNDLLAFDRLHALDACGRRCKDAYLRPRDNLWRRVRSSSCLSTYDDDIDIPPSTSPPPRPPRWQWRKTRSAGFSTGILQHRANLCWEGSVTSDTNWQQRRSDSNFLMFFWRDHEYIFGWNTQPLVIPQVWPF